MDDLGPIAGRTRSKLNLRGKSIKGIINERRKKSLNHPSKKIGDKNNLKRIVSNISNRESDNNYRNENGASNDNNLKINPNNKNTDPNNLLNKANGTTRKVVGGILAGVGTAGAIASAAALIKVGAAGIVSALAGLVGAAAAPWAAIAIAGTAVAALIALTVTGIYLLATKPDNKDPQKVDNNMTQAEKNISTERKELDEGTKKRIERFEADLNDLRIQAEKDGSTKEEIERNIKNLEAFINKLKKK